VKTAGEFLLLLLICCACNKNSKIKIIDAKDSTGLVLINTHDVTIKNLHVRGSGRKNGNTSSGIRVINSYNITFDSVEIEGFQKSGLSIESSHHIAINRVYSHDNGYAGISTMQSSNIRITNSFAENNPGDPTNFTNHSGNGIVVGYGKNIVIENCRATNNGWDMPRIGNGPVGIWAYECDSVAIQYCVSYRNRTSKGGDDGGGFDLDGGITNSVIRNCISYENEGSGYGLFQYDGASPWKNNIIKNNVSWNDGRVSAARAGIYVWNASGAADQLSTCTIVDNLIFNEKGTAINYATDSNHEKFQFLDNIFVCDTIFFKGISTGSFFDHNVTTSTHDHLAKSRNCVICALK